MEHHPTLAPRGPGKGRNFRLARTHTYTHTSILKALQEALSLTSTPLVSPFSLHFLSSFRFHIPSPPFYFLDLVPFPSNFHSPLDFFPFPSLIPFYANLQVTRGVLHILPDASRCGRPAGWGVSAATLSVKHKGDAVRRDKPGSRK